MPTNLPHVRPGDLITAHQWNAVLDWLADLQATVSTLGPGGSADGPPVILSLQPDQPAVGSELLIFGSGFGVAVENVVTIANMVAQVLGGGGAQLRVRVPTVPGVPSSGLQTQLTVSNPRGFTFRNIRVMPTELTIPEGQLFVNMTGTPSGTLNPGTAEFTFTARAVVTIEETYTLTPLLTPQALASQWQAQVLDMSDTPISTITIPAGAPPDGVERQVKVRVTIPPGTEGTDCGLSLTIRSQRRSDLFATSPTFTLSVGSAPPPAEQLTMTRVSVQSGSLDADGTVVVGSGTTRVNFSVAGTEDGTTYVISTGTVPSGWTATVSGGNEKIAAGSQVTFRLDLTAPSGGTATFNLRVEEKDDTSVFGTLALNARRA